MELQELNTTSLIDTLHVRYVTQSELHEIMNINDTYAGTVMFDVNLQELIKTLNENDVTDNDILEDVNSHYHNELNFYKDIENDMFYMVIES